MKINAQILNTRTESFEGKRGKISQTILCCLDLDPTHPFLNTFDYAVNEEDVRKYGHNVNGKRIELGVSDFTPVFGGRLRARGIILKMA